VGSPWLELRPGPSGGGPLAAGSMLEGQVGQGVMDKLLELQPVVEGLIAQIDTLVGTLNTSVQRLDPILAQVESQLGTTQEALTEITGLIGTTRELFEQVKTEQTVLVDGVATTLARVNDELLPGLEKLLAESRGMVGESFGELDETLEILQERLPAFLAVTQETLENTRDITEAAKNTWPFRGYWKRKAKEEAEAARRGAGRGGQ
jgi:ABC-type transporter Mla subunit MlaD